MTVRIVADPADCIETALAAVAFTRNHVDVDFEQTPGVKPSPKQLRATPAFATDLARAGGRGSSCCCSPWAPGSWPGT